MKKILFVVLGILILAAPSWAMIPNYSFVHNSAQTLDSNNNLIVYSKVIAEGYASGCCIPPSTTHQAMAYQKWISGSGTSGGYAYGPRLCWTCNLYAESDGQVNFGPVQFAPLNYDVTEDDEGEVNCSIAGTFWSVFQYFDFEVAYTRSKNTGIKLLTVTCPSPGGGTCYVWQTNPYCSPATTPPDWSPGTDTVPAEIPYLQAYYIDGVTACFRIRGTGQLGWICPLPGPSIAYPISSGLFPGNCTHTP